MPRPRLNSVAAAVRRRLRPAAASTEVAALREELSRLREQVVSTQREVLELCHRVGHEITRDAFAAQLATNAERARDRWRAAAAPAVTVAHPSPMVLPEQSTLRREPPRKPKDQQPDYLEEFDFSTVLYDAFRRDDDIWLSGPPMRNLLEPFAAADWRLDGRRLGTKVNLRDWGRTQRSSIVDPGPGADLTVTVDGHELSSRVGSDDAMLFAGHRALISKSKDNDLVWIQDWLRYYNVVHGVTAVVLYDNNSTRYTSADVAAAIAEVEGIEVAVVVAWNHPWGPLGGPKMVFDSDFSQYSMLEHGRFRYLRHAAGVVNCDIDELVLTDDGRSVFDYAAASLVGGIIYDGAWIAKATTEVKDPDRQRRFVDYRHRAGGKTSPKWTVIPSRLDPATTQWRIHSLSGAEASTAPAVVHRHYQGINNGWKVDRLEIVVEPQEHVYDARMDLALQTVFGD